jgi:hypothetical protein
MIAMPKVPVEGGRIIPLSVEENEKSFAKCLLESGEIVQSSRVNGDQPTTLHRKLDQLAGTWITK